LKPLGTSLGASPKNKKRKSIHLSLFAASLPLPLVRLFFTIVVVVVVAGPARLLAVALLMSAAGAGWLS